jgi:hypothetical protein
MNRSYLNINYSITTNTNDDDNNEDTSLPMEYRLESINFNLTENIEEINNLKKKIFNTTTQSCCFNGIEQRKSYFLNTHKHLNYYNLSFNNLLNQIVKETFIRPYCCICHYKLLLFNRINSKKYEIKLIKYIVEHEHDDSRKVNGKSPGRFRGITCYSCNQLEANARKLKNNQQKQNYWVKSFKNKKKSDDFIKFVLNNLSKYGYFDDMFKHNK